MATRHGGVWFPKEHHKLEVDIAQPDVDVIIPALDEEDSLPLVLEAIPSELVRRVVVVDNGSEDATASVAR